MTTSIKTCFKCLLVKPITDFYRHKGMADGHLNKCKTCNKSDVSDNYYKRHGQYKAYDRGRLDDTRRSQARLDYARTDEGRAARRRAREAWQQRNPKQESVRVKFGNALRAGAIWKSPCCMAPGCFSQQRLHGHHTSYDEPYLVVWLCQKCHASLHKEHNRRVGNS
jgi:hypothetical protein